MLDSMGTVMMSQMWMLRWVVLLMGLQSIQADFMVDYGVSADPMDFTTTEEEWPTTTAVYPSNHVNSICSMWGNFHFETFDGDVYRFPGMCEYNLVSDCQSLFRQFSVYVKRTEHGNDPKISRVSITIDDISIKLTENQVMINGQNTTLPVHIGGILVEENTNNTRVTSKLGITVTWNKEDAVIVELDSDYSDHTCGLCGNFNGVPDEFIKSDEESGYKRRVGFIEFGNRQRVFNPTDNCQDPSEEDDENDWLNQCNHYKADCEDLLENEDWSSCIRILSPEPYVNACILDMCLYEPEDSEDNSSLCTTLSEYSRQCSLVGGIPPNWRRDDFCAVTCPYNMVYSENGSPCMDTCLHKVTLCEVNNIDGCFCPSGTVFDDITNMGCIPVEQCQCMHNGTNYTPGEVLRKEEEECTCEEGNWICESIPGPGLCAVEEGSHFTTYDGKEFTFHGECSYVLSKDCENANFTILVQIYPCGTLIGTCLKSIEVLFYKYNNNRLVINYDGAVQHNAKVSLPYVAADFIVFMPSSFYIMLQTSFGLQVQVQLVPLMQVYITLDRTFQGKTCGLCGNFNEVLSDDLKTPQGLVEGTAVSFANAWKAQSNCPDHDERMEDPCSYSSEIEHFAEYWCSKMKDKESLFAKCHTSVNPDSYYKRCKYSSCTCKRSEDCLCAVYSSYARACAAKGIFLQGWREIVCEKYTENCPASQNYSYQLQSCQRTCLSLASERQSCSVDFVPVDGCACPDGFYQDKKVCVPIEKCPCYHKGEIVQPGKSIDINNEHCICVNGALHCQSWKTQILECPTPKVFFNCSTAGPDGHGLECAKTCLQKEVYCFSLDCESGCQCPTGLLDDGKGNCVKPHECPCPHDGELHAPGTKINVDCNNCTCQQGTWNCTEDECPAVCTIYGSGHYKTFDQQRFGFRGDCSYIAAQDKCGNKTGNFHVITENIPCGTTGTTCSKAVSIILGKTVLELSDGTVKVSNTNTSGPQINYRERKIGMYLVIDTDIGLTVMWDRKTTIRIILQPQHMGNVCGLCGNFNGNGKDDFTTQGSLQTTDLIEFVDSWKVSSNCPDAAPDFDPCFETPNRVAWAKRECIIIMQDMFTNCSKKVDPEPYYENCVKDSCACDTGGDCECLCTAVAAYAQACNEAGVYVDWRTPEFCPVYCDYYNKDNLCVWHYSPFTPWYETCSNQVINNNTLPNVEGCYPKCPEDNPIFDEIQQKCVKNCSPRSTPPPSTSTTISITPVTPSTTVSTKVPSTTSTTPSTSTTTSTTPITPSTTVSTEVPSTTSTTPLTSTTTSTTPITPSTTVSTETPSTTSTTPGTPPPSTSTTTSTTPVTPSTTVSTEAPSTTSTTPGTPPPSTPTTTSTTPVTPSTTVSTEAPSTTSTTPGTPPPSTSTTTSTTPVTSRTTVSTEAPSTTSTTTSTAASIITGNTTSTTIASTGVQILNTTSPISCSCVFQGRQYKPGETILDKKDNGSGICLTMICSITCDIQNITEPCPTPTPPPPPHECPTWNKTTNETFHLCDCIMAKCIKGDIIEIFQKQCPSPNGITCKNNQPAVLVYDELHCCQQYTCDCFCQGWVGSHYITFDGLSYTYQGNCTYILMEEISPKYNLTIYFDNVYCDIHEPVSCPRSIIVSYNNQNITLRNHRLMEGVALEALKDNVNLTLPYTNNGLRVIKSSLNLILEIPELKVVVTFGNTDFSINLPFQHFGNNTQGQCGTCNNNQIDDCMLPGGILVNDCAVMADHWTASGVDSKNCIKPSPTPSVLNISTPMPITPYKNDCHHLNSEVFEACHSHVSPDNFLLACQYDSFHTSDPSVVCASLQSYARACSQAGVCIHWRNYTSFCNITCPEDKIFLPCGPAEPPTCRGGPTQGSVLLTEGCFCPENTTLFSTGSGLCVSKCGCVDSSGTPREIDEHFKYNCEDCVCDKASHSVMCKPKKCPDVTPENCTEPGFMLSNMTDPSDPCCSKQVCRKIVDCSVSMCKDGSCTNGSCIYVAPDNTTHTVKAGEEYKNICETVTCHQINGSFVTTITNTKCPYLSSQECELGFEYVKQEGECCGTCTQVACIYDAPDNTRQTLKVGEVHNYKCENVTCQKLNGLFVTEKTIRECLQLSSQNCGPGFEYMKTESDCCETCTQVACIYDAPDNTRHVLKDGEAVKYKCENVTCHQTKDSFKTNITNADCVYLNSQDCGPGFEYMKKEGECCGECRQVACIYDAPDNTRQTLKVGEEKIYTCENVTCRQMNDSFISERTKTECPYSSSLSCGSGFEYVKKEGECCGSCTQVACIYDAPNNTRQILKDGEVHSYTCETVACNEYNGLFVTEKTKTECPYLSSQDCGSGFEYQKNEGECCGECVQVACVYDAPDNTRHVLNSGQEYIFKCMNTTCLTRNGMFMTKETNKQCLPFNRDDCKPGTVQYDNDGCCEICEPSDCVRVKNVTHLDVNGCTSIEAVEVTSCAGHCDDGSMYSMENDIMMHSCSCCREESITRKEVMLRCADGIEIPHNYTYIETCKCSPTKCEEDTGKNEHGQFTEINLVTLPGIKEP